MKTLRCAAVLALVSVVIVPAILSARNSVKKTPERLTGQPAPWTTNDRPLGAKVAFSGASVDTFILAEYGFEDAGGVCDTQGWYSVDLTAQLGVFFHVDDFAGMGGGDFGRLTPLEGNQSLWCGARADSVSESLCSYATLPGYGDRWDQTFESVPMPVSGDATLSYHIRWDSESGYDYTYVEYVDTSGAWVELANYDGIGETVASWVIPESSVPDTLIVR
ncbi:MAG: hypothetical protein KAJ17_14175, partial [Candidatus Krumholzibacteria bacterium]|nr:hypothetical protein [Candidatus Krumholzibacteria bacterium]